MTFHETRLEAIFPNDVRVRFASLSDPDIVRGWTLDGLVVDEASECPDRAFYETLRPMLLDTGGWTWFLYTPKGRNWTCVSGRSPPPKSGPTRWRGISPRWARVSRTGS